MNNFKIGFFIYLHIPFPSLLVERPPTGPRVGPMAKGKRKEPHIAL